MSRGKREIVYDDCIFPLMQRISDICDDNNIPMLATFELDVDDPSEPDNPINCTTIRCPGDATGTFFKHALRTIGPRIGHEIP